MQLPLPTEFFERLIVESLKLPARLRRGVIEAIVGYEDSAELARIPGAALTVYPETGHCPN